MEAVYFDLEEIFIISILHSSINSDLYLRNFNAIDNKSLICNIVYISLDKWQ